MEYLRTPRRQIRTYRCEWCGTPLRETVALADDPTGAVGWCSKCACRTWGSEHLEDVRLSEE
jgi:hypothetical protein